MARCHPFVRFGRHPPGRRGQYVADIRLRRARGVHRADRIQLPVGQSPAELRDHFRIGVESASVALSASVSVSVSVTTSMSPPVTSS